MTKIVKREILRSEARLFWFEVRDRFRGFRGSSRIVARVAMGFVGRTGAR